MTILTEGENSFFISGQAIMVDTDRDLASEWASRHIVNNPALKWIVAKYVEANNANSNGQYWSLEDLRMNQMSIHHSPMNMGHRANEIVGTFVASEMIYPAHEDQNPYIETVGAFWKYYFPNELAIVEMAYNAGALWTSMECVSESVTCVGPEGCGQTFPYQGPHSDTYCEHIQEGRAYRQLDNPHFLAGALIYPPDRPGWKSADVKEFAGSVPDEEKDRILAAVAAESPHLSAAEWEQTMFSLLSQQYKADLASKVRLSSAEKENKPSAKHLAELAVLPTLWETRRLSRG